MAATDPNELITKIASPILTLITVTAGIWQFNRGQEALKERDIAQRQFEIQQLNNQATIATLSKFKEDQHKLYMETTSVISFLTVETDFQSLDFKTKQKRFWQLYWVELSAVETHEVECAMVKFGDVLKELEDQKFGNYEEKKKDLQNRGYEVAEAIKISARTWEVPEQLKKINSTDGQK